ncbi:site-specific integrase [Succinimonas amylolytica]|uniref:site-specific integrase n=1 Tax=Succinimonas amylolytica TaxID=83769 RepID=UPI0003637474|nr:site-specific integrase [Succinimonas amylolytica]
MTFEEITSGLRKLLTDNNYNLITIRFYEREWSKIHSFLTETYGDSMFDMERGLAFLENKYGFQTKYNDGTLSQQRVQLLRVVHMLEDYRLHHVITRRYYAAKNPIKLNECFSDLHSRYTKELSESEMSKSTIEHYTSISQEFMDYLSQKNIESAIDIRLENCNGYIKTLAGYSFKTVEQKICGLRHFLRFLYEIRYISADIATEIHMPAISKKSKIPSAWSANDLKMMINAIDRNSPIGKRDYAMILLACVLGLRVGDIKNLNFGNFDWENKQLSLVQHKTHKPLTLPLPDAVGWAVIDYIKNGRPRYFESDVVFLKHMPPFDPISDNDHLEQRIVFYMNKAGIRRDKNRHSGFHSLRHSAGSMLLDMGTPLPVITTILGHSDIDITGIYLKTDLEKLAECVLTPEDDAHA